MTWNDNKNSYEICHLLKQYSYKHSKQDFGNITYPQLLWSEERSHQYYLNIHF
jgi:hypothetical protein